MADHNYLRKKPRLSAGNQCFAINCYHYDNPEARKLNDISFHRFPNKEKEPERWHTWWTVSRRQEIPSKNATLCSAHFKESMIDKTGQTRRLKQGAMPTFDLVDIPTRLKKRSATSRVTTTSKKACIRNVDADTAEDMPGGDCCSAYGCTNSSIKRTGVKFHRFPQNNPALLKAWIIATKWKNFTPTKYSKICSNHFKDSDYSGIARQSLLLPTAVPSIFDFPKHLQKKKGVERKRRVLQAPRRRSPILIRYKETIDSGAQAHTLRNEHAYFKTQGLCQSAGVVGQSVQEERCISAVSSTNAVGETSNSSKDMLSEVMESELIEDESIHSDEHSIGAVEDSSNGGEKPNSTETVMESELIDESIHSDEHSIGAVEDSGNGGEKPNSTETVMESELFDLDLDKDIKQLSIQLEEKLAAVRYTAELQSALAHFGHRLQACTSTEDLIQLLKEKPPS
ncbi:THAP domain-containing protein 5-like isoform X2 [Watersipora subatra]|uniref:THAP domain-containing protein 5-like isoform X2 n=1 Tax=Watersipora subatra TaxID=2589382 RepID=UPI00355ACF1D